MGKKSLGGLVLVLGAAAPSFALAQLPAERAAQGGWLMQSMPLLAVFGILFWIQASLKPYTSGGWPWSLALLALSFVSLALSNSFGVAAFLTAILQFAGVFLPLIAILFWPTYWAAATAVLMLLIWIALQLEGPGAGATVSELPTSTLLMIAVYVLVAAGLVAVRRRPRLS